MKKTLSIVLALTMLFALCVPSFAAVTTGKIDQTGSTPGTTQSTNTPVDHDAVIKTDNTAAVAAGGVFTLEFPAETTIVWNTVDTQLDCTVYANLVTGKQLTVTATHQKDLTDGAKTLAYTITTDATQTYTDLQTATWNPVVHIAPEDWKAVPVEKTYSGTVTFEAVVNPAS